MNNIYAINGEFFKMGFCLKNIEIFVDKTKRRSALLAAHAIIGHQFCGIVSQVLRMSAMSVSTMYSYQSGTVVLDIGGFIKDEYYS